ncbi:hypothetical protein DPMN_095686 [Dreissena polymorpha]|uniref:Uncharacterized protein n=1 Tax=Dreissena polymorpha TaxID=45954 RepID=A0A9D4L8C9_DREPO|nr:hypothetical protein DPMN_095686 [Dreissena polymorpha]
MRVRSRARSRSASWVNCVIAQQLGFHVSRIDRGTTPGSRSRYRSAVVDKGGEARGSRTVCGKPGSQSLLVKQGASGYDVTHEDRQNNVCGYQGSTGSSREEPSGTDSLQMTTAGRERKDRLGLALNVVREFREN